jgi:DAACS family dicarboxylate/amino acid:cation (Na+ or H+) symporter
VTFDRLRTRIGLREKSASLGALVGSNFNNDGTALYEAVSALFISQLLVAQGLGLELTLTQQLLVVITSVAASVGAAGIPEAGLVTMTLVFNAVGLPVEYIALLLPVDWVSGSLPHGDQRHGRYERLVSARRPDPGAGKLAPLPP